MEAEKSRSLARPMLRYHGGGSGAGRDSADSEPHPTLPQPHSNCLQSQRQQQEHLHQQQREETSESWYGFMRDHTCALVLAQAAAAAAAGEASGVRVIRGPVRKLDIRGGTVLILPNSSSLSRWRDGLSWSASKKVGGFLLYRQVQPSALADHTHVAERSNLFHTGSLRANTTLTPNGLAKRTIVVTSTGSPGMSSTGFKIINYFYPEQVEHHYNPKVRPNSGSLRCASEALELQDYWSDTGKFRVVLGNAGNQNQSPDGQGTSTAFRGSIPREDNAVCYCGGLKGWTHVDELSRLSQTPDWMERPQRLPRINMYNFY